MGAIHPDRPLVFPVKSGTGPIATDDPGSHRSKLVVAIRRLDGMQKEAFVGLPAGANWRMVCDEGAYLNGTDLAPFPLGFFMAGQQLSLMADLLCEARIHGIGIRSLEIEQDNFYALDGSFVLGTALAHAMSPRIRIILVCETSNIAARRLVRETLGRSHALALLREPLENRFSLTLNGREISPSDLRPVSHNATRDPIFGFDSLAPDTEVAFRGDLVTKQPSGQGSVAESGSSLASEQKRTLHVRGESRFINDRLAQTMVWPLQPVGSQFRFVGDVSPTSAGTGLTPHPFAYTAAGIGFCFMTQLGRYAHIKKLPIREYRIVQECRLDQPVLKMNHGIPPRTAFDTHVFIETPQTSTDASSDESLVQDLVRMSERTCFLHAALRGSHSPQTTALINGQEFDIDTVPVGTDDA